MATLEIVPATPADVAVVLELIQALAEYEKLSHICVATEESLLQTLFGNRPAAQVLLAREGTETLGFALYFQNYSTFLSKPGLYLEDLFVKPEFRARGVGKALLLRLAAIAVERGYGRMEWSVLDWNELAIGFYKRLGADILPDWRICRVTGKALQHFGQGDTPSGLS
jgi:GNAT superfamily N-acetyltransferase